MSDREELAALRRMAELEMRDLKASQASKESTRAQIDADAISRSARAFPTEGGTVLPGIGSTFNRYAMGAKQLVGAAGPEEEAERRSIDAPLSRTIGGKSGQLLGDLAVVAPAAITPGANTVLGSGIIGGLTGGIQPVVEGESRGINTAIGAGVGAGVAGALKGVTMLKDARQAAGAAAQSKNALRDATLREGFDAGYVVPPSAAHKGGTFIGNRLEGIAGKAALNQEASIKNQEITNRLARQAAGLADDVPISEGALANARSQMAAPYREVAQVSPRAASALERLQDTRLEAKLAWNEFNRQGSRQAYKDAVKFDRTAELLEDVIEREATNVGKPDLLQSLRQARVAIAKNHDVERALNVATGDVDAAVVGKMYDKAPRRMTGELATIGKFQQAFPAFTREASKVQAPGVSKLEGFGAAALGIGGAAATGSPAGLLAAGLPFLSSPTRKLLLSELAQSAPKYGPGATLRLADLGARNKLVQSVAPAFAAGVAPQLVQQ
jgi:hypothetical protein